MPEMNNFKSGNNIYEVADSKARGISLTWAQYQALSYEEQHNGTAYYITDMDAIYPVDHELNANSVNAVANDIVTPHILAMENVLGAKNLANNDATTKTDSGVLFTVNADKSVTVQRQTSTTDPYSYIKLFDNKTLPATLLKVSGCPNVTGLALYLYDKTTSTRYNQTGDEIEVTPVAGHTYSFVIEALNSADLDTAVTVYPMIRQAGTDPTYVKHAMTNDELTESIENIVKINDVKYNSTDGFYAEDRMKLAVIGGTYKICLLNGIFKCTNGLTAGTEYTVATVPYASLRDCTQRVRHGIIYINANSTSIKFKPDHDMGQYDGDAISLSFIS